VKAKKKAAPAPVPIPVPPPSPSGVFPSPRATSASHIVEMEEIREIESEAVMARSPWECSAAGALAYALGGCDGPLHLALIQGAAEDIKVLASLVEEGVSGHGSMTVRISFASTLASLGRRLDAAVMLMERIEKGQQAASEFRQIKAARRAQRAAAS